MNNGRNREAAFTLVEIIIAMVILLVGLLAVAQLFIVSTYSNVFAQNSALSVKAAEYVLEDLRSINNWNSTTGGTKANMIQPGGTVRMVSDGGPSASTLPAKATSAPFEDQAHIAGVALTPVFESGRLKNYAMTIVKPSDLQWSKRRFEVRWQVIGYNAAGSPNPPATLNITDAYDKAPSFTALSAPTPPKANGEQSSAYVIVRVAPVLDTSKTGSRVQLVGLLVNPN